jgi:hypothetical protein
MKLPEKLTLELLERAMGLIANASGGNWELQTKEWYDVASKWMNDYQSILSAKIANTVPSDCKNCAHVLDGIECTASGKITWSECPSYIKRHSLTDGQADTTTQGTK